MKRSDRGGVAVPVTLCVSALGVIVAVAFLLWISLRSDDTCGSSSDDTCPAASSGGVRDGEAVVDTFSEAAAQRLAAARARLSDVIREHERVERELQGARYAALKSDPDLKAELDRSQTLKREVAEMIAALPERREIEQRREQHIAEMQAVEKRTEELEQKVVEGRKAREKALADGQPSPIEESTMRQMVTELKQLRNDKADLKKGLLVCTKDARQLQLESTRSHPTISAKAVEAERIRHGVSDAILNHPSVSPVAERREELVAERKTLVKECAELGSR